MRLRTKKTNSDGIVRLETSGEIKEIIINEEFLHSGDASISICFRGEDSSGIIDLAPKEIEVLNKELALKHHLFKDVKIMKFDK